MLEEIETFEAGKGQGFRPAPAATPVVDKDLLALERVRDTPPPDHYHGDSQRNLDIFMSPVRYTFETKP